MSAVDGSLWKRGAAGSIPATPTNLEFMYYENYASRS